MAIALPQPGLGNQPRGIATIRDSLRGIQSLARDIVLGEGYGPRRGIMSTARDTVRGEGYGHGEEYSP